MKWIEALKKYNASKGKWNIPKKGTREHGEVMSIMKGNDEINAGLSLENILPNKKTTIKKRNSKGQFI